jgi:membrane protease YdiL (CAAX protease family)
VPSGMATQVLSGIGAGIYEEFLFRLIAIGLLLVLTVDVLNAPRKPMVVVAIVLSSVVFSLSHFLGAEHFHWGSFVFRALAGVYLAVIYVFRGFGIAVGTHACYNVALTLMPM